MSEQYEDLAQVAGAILDLARQLRSRGLSDPQIVPLTPVEAAVLHHVRERAGITPGQMALELGLQASNASVVVRALEGYGFIERTPDQFDRRVSHLNTTAAAEEQVQRVHGERARILDSCVAGLDVTALATGLTTIANRLRTQ